ncbi:MAG TPA: outer membrane lipoprotein carrier protein LolA [Kiloniellales bacterium]
MRRYIAALFLSLAIAGAGTADVRANTGLAALSPDDAAAVQRAIRYLNDLSTVRARFVQVSSNGTYAEGEVIIERPGRLRFEYDPPNPVLLIANGLSLLFYDRDLKQASFLPLWETPLWFLIRDQVQLSDTVQVTAVERGQGVLKVTLRDKDSADAGSLSLIFGDSPLSLRKWELVDAQGISTQVSLVNPEFGVPVDPAAFNYDDLKIPGRIRGLNR